MSTLIIAFGKRVPVGLINAVSRAIDLSYRCARYTATEVTYFLREPFDADSFYPAFDRIAKDYGCGMCFNGSRYVFAQPFMDLCGALHPLQPDGNGAVA